LKSIHSPRHGECRRRHPPPAVQVVAIEAADCADRPRAARTHANPGAAGGLEVLGDAAIKAKIRY